MIGMAAVARAITSLVAIIIALVCVFGDISLTVNGVLVGLLILLAIQALLGYRASRTGQQ